MVTKGMRNLSLVLCLAMLLSLLSGCQLLEESSGDSSWDLVLKSVRGTQVDLLLWGQDPAAEEWLETSVKRHLQERYEVTLKIQQVDSQEYFKELRESKKALVDIGSSDLLWLSPSSFAQLKGEGLLYGPFGDKVLNARTYLDPKSLDTLYMDGTPIKGYALPFNQQQLTFYYNEDMTYEPPTDLAGLKRYLEGASGTFTYPMPEDPIGRAFIHSVILTYTPAKAFVEKQLTDAELKVLVKPGLEYLKAIAPNLYQGGVTYPKDAQAMQDLFAESKLFMVMSDDYRHANELTGDAIYPGGTRPIIFGEVSVGAKDYLSIPYLADNKSGAMVVMHALLDLEMQTQKLSSKTYQGLPVYDSAMVTADMATAIKKALNRKTIPEITKVMEQRSHDIPSQYHAKIAALWRQIVLQP